MQELLDKHKTSMPDAVYQELIEAVGYEAQRGLKLVTYTVARSHKDGMNIDRFSTICKPQGARRYTIAYLLQRGEYDPEWLEREFPLVDALEDTAYMIYKIEDLERMPKRRRTEVPIAPSTPTVEPDE